MRPADKIHPLLAGRSSTATLDGLAAANLLGNTGKSRLDLALLEAVDVVVVRGNFLSVVSIIFPLPAGG
jgi:hypothetical protein